MSSGSRFGGGEVSVGIGVFESVVRIREFRGWAWVGLLIENPTKGGLTVRRSRTSVVTVPPLPKVRVFLYGPVSDPDIALAWREVDLDSMRNRLLSLGNPIPDIPPASEVTLNRGDRAVLWIYLEDKFVDEVSVFVSIEVGGDFAQE